MKWYFALNTAAVAVYELHVKAAVRSARRNTTLSPHLIYDGEEGDLCRWMRAEGVRVIPARVPFYERMMAARERGYVAETATGAFLRTQIPVIDGSDDIVLYTDCDVLFLREPVYVGPPIRYFAVGPETDIEDYSASGMNTGTMLMNLPALRKCQADFDGFISDWFETFIAFDQGAYRLFFNGLWERLDPVLNWKPYWGVNPDAQILHFHGPKYREAREMMKLGRHPYWRYEVFFQSNPDAYAAYVDVMAEFV